MTRIKSECKYPERRAVESATSNAAPRFVCYRQKHQTACESRQRLGSIEQGCGKKGAAWPLSRYDEREARACRMRA